MNKILDAPDSIAAVASSVTDILHAYCVEQQSAARHTSHKRAWEVLDSVITGGGKRLRPYMFITAYCLDGRKPTTAAMNVAAAWEMLHQCMLIHDDIIDRDFMRHGKLNMNGTYREMYSSYAVSDADRDHYANSAAIIGGDLALSAAYELILTSGLDGKQIQTATRYLRNAIHAVALGELQDTETALVTSSADDALLIAEMKTASYSFIGPLQSGAALAGYPEHVVAQLEIFGKSLGIAFQLQDDVLSVFGDEAITGKLSDSDIREGKQTLLVNYARAAATDQQANLLETILGNHESAQNDIEQVKQMFRDTGALRQVETEIAQYTKQAEDALIALGPNLNREKLRELADKLLDRDK